MLKTIIYGIASLICFIASAFVTRSSKRKGAVIFWWLCFLVAFGLQVKSIYEGHQSSKTMVDLRKQVRLAQEAATTASNKIDVSKDRITSSRVSIKLTFGPSLPAGFLNNAQISGKQDQCYLMLSSGTVLNHVSEAGQSRAQHVSDKWIYSFSAELLPDQHSRATVSDLRDGIELRIAAAPIVRTLKRLIGVGNMQLEAVESRLVVNGDLFAQKSGPCSPPIADPNILSLTLDIIQNETFNQASYGTAKSSANVSYIP